jgi:hypothetical protein
MVGNRRSSTTSQLTMSSPPARVLGVEPSWSSSPTVQALQVFAQLRCSTSAGTSFQLHCSIAAGIRLAALFKLHKSSSKHPL